MSAPYDYLVPRISRTSTIAIANTETQILGLPILANKVIPGATYKIMAYGLWTNPSNASPPNATIRIRMGPTSLLGNIPATCLVNGGATARTNIPFAIRALMTILTIGASGSAIGVILPTLCNVVAPVLSGANTSPVSIDTTIDNILEMTFISGASAYNIQVLSALIIKEV